MARFIYVVLLVALATTLSNTPTLGAVSGVERVANGLNTPVYATHAPGDRDRLFVVEQGGAIKIVDLNTNSVSGTFMTVPGTKQQGEGGLLGLAFHPNYYNEGQTGFGKFYVYVSVDNGGIPIDGETSPFSSRIREYSVSSSNANIGNAGSGNEIISWVKPRDNHNGGWIGFNPVVTEGEPQYLYINSGDGGKQNDPDNNAQTIVNEKLGKILRVDINSDAFPGDATRDYAIPPDNPFVGVSGDDEIWAYGLRNPWRASFDRQTGDYWVGDVGNASREEIDKIPDDKVGANNLGWKRFEGNADSQPSQPVPADYIPPVYDYLRNTPESFNGRAVNGGYVYRGPDPSLQGLYFFSDSSVKNAWTFDPADATGTVDNINSELGTLFNTGVNTMVSFGEDPVGNLYIVDYQGEVYRILTNELIAGDYNADGEVDDADYAVWKADFGSTTILDADGNGDDVVDAADYTVWRDNFGSSVHNLAGGGGSVSVPEPNIAFFAVVSVGLALCHRSTRRSRGFGGTVS